MSVPGGIFSSNSGRLASVVWCVVPVRYRVMVQGPVVLGKMTRQRRQVHLTPSTHVDSFTPSTARPATILARIGTSQTICPLRSMT